MILTPGGQLFWGAMIAVVTMCGLWLVQVVRRDASIVDVGWAGLLGTLAIFYAVTQSEPTIRTWLVLAIAATAEIRLAIHLLTDRVIGKPEDGRYRTLRSRYGQRASLFFLIFFQIQALLAWLFSIPFWLGMHHSGTLVAWDLVGCAIGVVSICGEFIADQQLARFRSDPSHRGQVCRQGLWRYSRHPNYFFEWLHWWAYVAFSWNGPWGWISIAAPLLMLFFLWKVTGIPATEAQALLSRGDDYREYQRTTSPFIPWPPRKSSQMAAGGQS